MVAGLAYSGNTSISINIKLNEIVSHGAVAPPPGESIISKICAIQWKRGDGVARSFNCSSIPVWRDYIHLSSLKKSSKQEDKQQTNINKADRHLDIVARLDHGIISHESLLKKVFSIIFFQVTDITDPIPVLRENILHANFYFLENKITNMVVIGYKFLKKFRYDTIRYDSV